MTHGLVTTLISALALSSRAVNAFYLGAEPKIQAPSTAQPPEQQGPFVPWQQPLIVPNGDYRNEAHLEDPALPLYSMQQQLPRLPIPSLEDTMARFLPSALPLAETDDEKQTLLDACRQFPEQAKVLQERLLQRQQDFSDSSWLQQMWQTQAYLQVRDPLAVKVSYYLFVADDETLPAKNKGIARAAAMLVAMAQSRKQICSGIMPYETVGKDGLCSTAFKYIFHSTRIPTKPQDVYHVYDPSRQHHCIVACREKFFAVDFCDEITGDPLPLSVLEQRLKRCVELASLSEETPEMGWLTSTDRDFWADARQELLDIGGSQMSKALTKLESGAFVLTLDDDEPESLTGTAKVFWYGGDDDSGGNRWFDKSLQLVCTKNGRVGYVGEHSMLDAAPVIPLIRRIIKTPYKRLKQKEESLDEMALDPNSGVEDIFAECWSSSPSLTAAASKLTCIAKEHHRKLTSDHELEVKLFEGYGKKFIKSAGFICHDYVQMAMQLAAYRLFGQQVGTYEAALTRTFLHGRTETARPVSPQSQAFIECMGLTPNGDHCSIKEKYALLKQAASTHAEAQRMASNGMGVDRHLFGLVNMLQDEETEPSLFSHPLYLRSKHWRLSTSSVIFTPGFGPVVDDGLGIGYRVDANACMFTCTSRKENNYIERFCNLLDEALVEMGDLVKMNLETPIHE